MESHVFIVMSMGIYKITSPSGRVYIGQSVNIQERFKKYYKLGCKRQPKLYNSFIKYGINNHKFEIIEECIKDQLNNRELYWGTLYKVLEEGLNLKLGNSKNSLSEETKQKISLALIGKSKSKEHCINLSNAKKGIPSKRKGKSDLKQRGKPKPGVSLKSKGKPKIGSGPKTGSSILNIETGDTYKSIKECMDINNINKSKMFKLLKDPNSNFKYTGDSYYKK